ncbi:MAG: ring-cleaving dioxygenase [Bacteroidota bacterium]
MNTKTLIKGLHHVTATVNDAIEDYTFYTKLLGFRLVKKTVNFDNNKVYHFYYGNEAGEPGTLMTTFPYKGHGVRDGVIGTGQVKITAFAVPTTAIEFWTTRLNDHDIAVEQLDKFGDPTLRFRDPSGLYLELVGTNQDEREPWTTADISIDHAIRGIHSATLSVAELDPSVEFLLNEFGMQKIAENGNVTRFEAQDGGSGALIDLLHEPDGERGHNGIGTVHHIAWRVENDEALLAMRHRLADELDFRVTDVKDRNYFHSIYFRMPGKILFEIATLPPGFAVDEPLESLGEHLKLPEWEEVNREQITSVLPSLS